MATDSAGTGGWRPGERFYAHRQVELGEDAARDLPPESSARALHVAVGAAFAKALAQADAADAQDDPG